MEFTDRINQIAEYFHGQINDIHKLSLPDSQNGKPLLYQKTLLVTMIDCLAGFRFDKKNYSNRARFIKFVQDFGNWPDGRLISIPFLKSRLEKENLKGQLFYKICELLQRYDPNAGNGIQLSAMDLLSDKLIPLTTCKSENNAINEAQHYSLLYGYRN